MGISSLSELCVERICFLSKLFQFTAVFEGLTKTESSTEDALSIQEQNAIDDLIELLEEKNDSSTESRG